MKKTENYWLKNQTDENFEIWFRLYQGFFDKWPQKSLKICKMIPLESVINQGSTDRLVRGPTGPNRSEIFKILLVLVRVEISQIFSVLVWSGPRFLTGFGPWIPATVQHNLCYISVHSV